MTSKRQLVVLGALVIAALLVPWFASGAGTARAATAAAIPAGRSLPPSARADLVAIFGPKVRRFGLHVTRAALVDTKDHRNPRGTHLAIYVEPTGAYTPQDYIDGTVEVTKMFLPYVFARWKDLKSFDLCQEPRPAVDNRASPPPETQVYASRVGSDMVNWSTADVGELVSTSTSAEAAAGAARPVEFSLYIAAHLKNTPAYQDAVTSGADSATSTPPTTHAYG